jgi:predicted amidohydrolase
MAEYRKLHMFDVEAGGVEYRESDHERAGDELVVADLDPLRIGLTVCYDLRFPELFRALLDRGANAFTVPSAFTSATGRDHWEVLLRARAIENQAFVLASNQAGTAEPSYDSWGHSMIVDPWGEVLAEVETGEGYAVADLDLRRQAEVRSKLPAVEHRRPEIFGEGVTHGS